MMKRNSILATILALGLLAATPGYTAAGGGNQSFLGGNYLAGISTDVTKPVPDKSYFTTSADPIPGGARLTVEIYHGKLDSPVSLSLQVAINDGAGNVRAIPIKVLDSNVSDNPKLYYSKRTFDLSYNELNKALSDILPAAAQGMKIGPGTPLFVYGNFPAYGHSWGSIDRGGIFYMPEVPGTKEVAEATSVLRKPTELDLAFPIHRTMVLKYNDLKAGTGIKEGGQIRSRVESEGKFQIPLTELDRIKQELFAIANDPVKAEKLLGADWTIKAEMRYMKKDSAGNLILDSKGLPTPDPMVDTYYDNEKFDAAKNDIALRYRWTEGNATGSWNFKPGIGKPHSTGIVDRIEFGVDTTDDKPETIRKFSDSMDPLNPFKILREVVPGSVPSEFLQPAVKITDMRYKFKLQHKNGLVIEISADNVTAESLREKIAPIQYGQLEMDIDHLSTASTNVAQQVAGSTLTTSPTISTYDKQWLDALKAEAGLDGRPVMHTVEDLDAKSAVRAKHQADFDLAAKVIVSIRDNVIGPKWIPGAQKYAYAAESLRLVSEREASASVKKALELEKKYANGSAVEAETVAKGESTVSESAAKKAPRAISAIALKCPTAFN